MPEYEEIQLSERLFFLSLFGYYHRSEVPYFDFGDEFPKQLVYLSLNPPPLFLSRGKTN
jgi:hypothetical protein